MVTKAEKTTSTTTPSTAGRAGRSPSYPAFSLETAIEKLKTLHKAQRNNAVSVGAALESLGYKSETSGTAQRTIAALISYGLVAEEGTGTLRKVRVTELGRRIVLLPEDDPERVDALREAAVKPRIYNEILAQYPETLPTDTEMKKFLTLQKGYNEDTVRLLIRDFKATYNFAELGERGTIAEETTDKRERNRDDDNGSDGHSKRGKEEMTPPSPPAGTRNISIPISGGRMVYLHTPSDFSPDDLKFVKVFLALMKDAITTGKVSAATEALAKPSPIRTGSAIWHNKDVDQPIRVTGDYGKGADGRQYATIEGSAAGVPLDEIEYEDDFDEESDDEE
jgi:hypothetical protein